MDDNDDRKAAAMLARLQNYTDPDPVKAEAAETEKAAAREAVAVLAKLGLQSVAQRRWLDADNDAPELRKLLTVRDGERTVAFMPAGKVAMIAAPGGTGKTQLLVQLAVSVASGRPWLETYAVPEPGPVLLVLGEEDHDEMHRRIRGAVDAMNAWPEADKIAANLHALSLCGVSAGMTNDKGDETAFFQQFRDGLKAWPNAAWRLIILDPASRFLGPEAEVDNAAATRWIEHAERLTQLPGRPTVLFAHHTNKGAMAGGTDQSAARGSSALTDGVRWQAMLDRHFDEKMTTNGPIKQHVPSMVELKIVKANHCPVQPMLLLRRDFDNGGYLKPEAVPQFGPEGGPPDRKAATAKGKKNGKAAGYQKGGDDDL